MLNLKGFLAKFKKNDDPYEWNTVSRRFYELVKKFARKNDKILEFGSSTGHISYRLAKDGYSLTLLDIRPGVIDIAKNIFLKSGIKANFICGNILDENNRYDFAWNSGLIQCLEDDKKDELIRKILLISKRTLLFYPDTENSKKVKGSNKNITPGVGDAKEYAINKIPEITYKYFNEIYLGVFKANEIGLDYNMYWLYALNKK